MVERPPLTKLKILRAWDETKALRGLVLAAGDLKSGHTAPGQILEVFPDPEGGSYFALANAPREGDFELLVKRAPGIAGDLAELGEGDTVESTAPMGRGFPVDEHRGRDLILLAAGSGIAPLRAVVRHVCADREGWGQVFVFYGHRHPDQFAYMREVPEWEKQGIEVVHTVSRLESYLEAMGPNVEADWTGPTGYVQDVLRAHQADVKNPAIYVCGMKQMVRGVRHVVGELGYDEDEVYLNF